jgi:hypothetical protein
MAEEHDGSIHRRGTADLVILILATSVGLMVLFSAASLFAIELLRPQADTSTGVAALSTVVSSAVNVILGAVAGFIAGRGARESSSPTQ